MDSQKHSIDIRKTGITISIDNQSIIYALSRRNLTSGQYLVDALRTAANDLHCHLKVRWVFTPSEVKGNKKADKLSKEAAGGRSSRRAKSAPGQCVNHKARFSQVTQREMANDLDDIA